MSARPHILRLDLNKLVDEFKAILGPEDLEQYKKLETCFELIRNIAFSAPPYIDEPASLESFLKEVRCRAKLAVKLADKSGQVHCEKHGFYDAAKGCTKCKKI